MHLARHISLLTMSIHCGRILQVKSVLDPCEDENDDMQDDGKSIGPDSVYDDQPSDSESEVKKVFICSSALTSYLHSTLLCLKRVNCCFQISQTQENQFILAPVGNDNKQIQVCYASVVKYLLN